MQRTALPAAAGVTTARTYHVKRIDPDYFDDE
jgi:hypothetical protein